MKFAIVVFPGSNCDYDCYHVPYTVLNQPAEMVWHEESALPRGTDVVIIPGGFSYGDYLRTGAIAKFSPIMKSIIDFAEQGGYVMGICNGFQILTECGLLPGALIRNLNMKFVCKDIYLKPANCDTAFTSGLKNTDIVKIPIAHGEGNYIIDDIGFKQLQDNNQIAFQYCSVTGVVSHEANPNGSLSNIAGVFNKRKNVMGMMPHPERCSEAILGNNDGLKLFESLLAA